MSEFKNGEKVYWDTSIGRYIGQDPYVTALSYVVDTHTGEVGTIQTASLSSEPPISQRELNGKSIFELWESTWDEVNDCDQKLGWDFIPRDTKEFYMRLSEKLNYKAGDEDGVKE